MFNIYAQTFMNAARWSSAASTHRQPSAPKARPRRWLPWPLRRQN
ncbi:MAG: hypothetical protein ACSHWZ_10525 [Sulfitobacter sp.]